MKKERIIAHLDMDAFFAAIEERDSPQFKGLPIAVGSDPRGGKGRGIVATANYKARVYGLHSAMPITRAWRLSQEAKAGGLLEVVFLPGNHQRYNQVSKEIMEMVSAQVPLVDVASIDEIYLDLSFLETFGKAEKFCKNLKKKIFETQRLTCSVGIGPNRLIAKIASGHKKPNGLTVVRASKAEDFLAPLQIRDLPGIGPKMEQSLTKLGIKTLGGMKQFSYTQMRERFGKWGAELYYKVRGLDDSPVGQDWIQKSIGEQMTLGEDTLDSKIILETAGGLVDEVYKRFMKSEFETFRRVVVTVRFEDFATFSRSKTLALPSGSRKILELTAIKMLLPFLDARENKDKTSIRLLGVRIENLL